MHVKNVCLLQNTTFLLSTQMLHPFLCLGESHQRGLGTQRWVPHPQPQPVPKAPSSLSVLGEEWRQAGSLQVLTGGPGLRLRGARSTGNLGHLVRS